MDYIVVSTKNSNELYHHGVKGQKWGVRRYQNEDGTLTAKGKKHLEKQEAKSAYKEAKQNYKTVYNNALKENGLIAPTTVSKNREYNKTKNKLNAYEKKVQDARINYNAAKKGNTEKALKKAYGKELRKYGLPNSARDAQKGYKGSALVNEMSKKHGEAFANDVLKTEKRKVITELSVALAAAGASYAYSLYKVYNG